MKSKLSALFKKEYLILYVIILLGSFLRLQGVLTNSFAFTYDVGRDMLALRNIYYLHKIPLIGQTTGLPGVFYGPWWYYILTPFFILFSGNPQGIAFVMALMGIFSIILGFLLGNKIGGNFLGLIIATLISISYSMISLSAQIWNPNIIPLFIILVLLVLNKLYSSGKNIQVRYYFLLGLLLTLIMDLEIVFGLFFSIGIILSAILIINKKISVRSVGAFILGGLVVLLPRIIFELRHQFLMTKSFIAFLGGGNSAHSFCGLLNILANRLGIFFDQFNSTLVPNNKILGYFIVVFIFFSLTLFYRKTNSTIKNYIKTSLIVIGVFLVGTVFFSHDIWPHYLVGLPVFYILLFSISLYFLGSAVITRAISVFIILVIIIINLNSVNFFQSFTIPLWEGNAAVYRNQLAVIDYVYSQAKGNNFKYVAYTPPVYDYTYQYLFLWYGPLKYQYSASVKSDLAYFVLEPDLENQNRLTTWLMQRKGDGKIIKSKTVKGGIIVQTRIH